MLNCLLAMNWLLFYRQRRVVFVCKLEFLPIRKLLQCINCFHKAIHANISHACHSELYNSVWPHFIISIHGLSDSFCHFCGQFNFNLLKRHFLLLKKCMYICVRLGSVSAFFSSRFLFFFFLSAFVDFGRQYLLLWTVYTLFTHCVVLKNIKNRSYDTIYTFKNYFVTILLIFKF